MALWGKGDPRWIVEERPDSTNVNNWHWTERDATNWSKEKLRKLFLSLKEENDKGSWKVDEIKKLDGEATLSNRKGKIIIFYEWDIQFTYKGTIAGSELNYNGTIHIPNLSDENSADDVDIEVKAKGDTENAEKLKHLVRVNGIKMCRNKCQEYLNDLKTEYTTGMVLPTKDIKKDKKTHTQSTQNGIKINENMKELNVKDKKPARKTCHVSLDLTEEFKTTADELYATLTLPERLSAFTRSHCKSSPVVGGEYSVINDNITGIYTEVEPGKKIVQKWRFKQWPADLYSIVTITLDQKSDCTLLKLSQTGVPDYDTVRTEDGWKQYFWGPMKQVFGFGAQLF